MNDNNQFSFYLDSLNIRENQDILVLTSHYYYDLDELYNIRVVVHTKELNRVRDIQGLMSSMMRSLSNGTRFIGCFIDNKFYYKSKVGYWLLHLTDMKNNKYVSRKQVIKLFLKHRLQIEDMTEVNGVTYFCVKIH